MWLPLLLTVLAIAAALLLFMRREPVPPGTKPIPSPPSSLLLGHLPLVFANAAKGYHLDVLLKELADQVGKAFTLNVVFFKFLILADPDMVKEVITRNFPKSFTYKQFFPILGGAKSLIVLEGDHWKKHRMAFNPGFSYQHLRTLIPTFVSNTKRLVERISKAAGRDEIVPLHHLLTLLTLNIICDTVLSKDFDLLSTEHEPALYIRMNQLTDHLHWYIKNPGFGWYRYMPWEKAKLRRLQAQYDNMLLDVIRERAASGADATDKSILSLAIRTAREEGTALDAETILAQVKTFLFAGHDTTASTVAWCVYELSRHPEVEKKMVQELRQVCGHGDPSADDLSRLQYMDCVIKEALRLWPPGAIARAGPPGEVINGYDVSGRVFYVSHYTLHRDTDLWGADAQEFKPERWLDEEAISRLHPYAYEPFSKGPRDCIGQVFAKLEGKTLLAMLYSKFSFSYAGSEPERLWLQLGARPRFGVPVRVTLRED